MLSQIQKLKPAPQATVSKIGAKTLPWEYVLTQRINIFGAELSKKICHSEGKLFLNWDEIHACSWTPNTHTLWGSLTFYSVLHLIIFMSAYVFGGVFLCSLRWRWSLRASWMEACSQRAIVTSAMLNSSPSPSAPLTMRWVRLCSHRNIRTENNSELYDLWLTDRFLHCTLCISLICTNLCVCRSRHCSSIIHGLNAAW